MRATGGAGSGFANPEDPEANMGALAGAAAQLNGATAALAAVAAPAGLAAEGSNSSRALRLALPQLVRAPP